MSGGAEAESGTTESSFLTVHGSMARLTSCAISGKDRVISTTTARFIGLRMPLSVGEETFLLHCRAYKLREPEREVILVPGRKWRVDFYWPSHRLAVEIEGSTQFGKSRHSRGQGFENDARKYNTLSLMGIKVMRFTTSMVQSGEAIDTVRAALEVLDRPCA